MSRRIRRLRVVLLMALLAPPAAYLLLAALLGMVPVHADFRPTPEERGGVPVYVRTNGVHADLVLPATGVVDWTREFARASVIDVARLGSVNGYGWIAIGWGDRGFYLNTPTWRELRWHTAWVALSGQGTGALHVEYVRRPEDFDVVRLQISEEQYRALAAAIAAFIVRDARGRPVRIDARGFGATDAFYEATGRYLPWLTSNDWVRQALAQAGVRTARWSPFDVAVMYQARRAAQAR